MVEWQPSRRNCYRSSERAECLGEELRDSDAAVVTRAWPPDVDGTWKGKSRSRLCVGR